MTIKISWDGQLPPSIVNCLHDTASPSFEPENVYAHVFATDYSCLFVFHSRHSSSSFIVSRLVLPATRPLLFSPFLYISQSHHHTGHVSCTLPITSARTVIRHEHSSICIACCRRPSTLSRMHQSPAVDCLIFCPSWQRREIPYIVTCTTRSYACIPGRVVTIRFLP